jgi:HEAT repeat protein
MLKAFSSGSDRHAFFRRFTFYSIMLAFPMAVYLVVFGLLRYTSSFSMREKAALVTASTVPLLLFSLLLVYLHVGRPGVHDYLQALESESWRYRIAALKHIERKGLEVGRSKIYLSLLSSPHIPERYWLARALGVSKEPETYDALIRLLGDPHRNVASMAFYALGKRRGKYAAQEILSRIRSSDDWYTQCHAYAALKAFGWTQGKSN